MNPRVRSVVRSAVLVANTPLARRRTARSIAGASGQIALEIGGIEQRPGWLVTNVNAVTRNYLDATRRWPLAAGSVRLVFADNVIEHLSLEQGRALLREAHRCLEPGGTIRLVTPDLRKHVDAYLRVAAGAGDVRSDELAIAYGGVGVDVVHPVDLVRIPVENFGHHQGYVYDAPALMAELSAAGFTEVRECVFGQSGIPDLQGLDNRTDEGPAQMAIEATRP